MEGCSHSYIHTYPPDSVRNIGRPQRASIVHGCWLELVVRQKTFSHILSRQCAYRWLWGILLISFPHSYFVWYHIRMASFRIYHLTRYKFEHQISTKSRVANPNWSLGCIQKEFQKYRFLGKFLTKTHRYYSMIGPLKLLWRAVGWPPLH